MEEIVLVRHAAATGQEATAPLTIDGQRQARALDHFLRRFRIDGAICSPFRHRGLEQQSSKLTDPCRRKAEGGERRQKGRLGGKLQTLAEICT